MSEKEARSRALREAVAPYSAERPGASHTKLSISLPTDLLELVRAVAGETGQSVSSVIAASLRRTLDTAEQERLDAAIAAQNEENLELAQAYAPIAARLWADLEW